MVRLSPFRAVHWNETEEGSLASFLGEPVADAPNVRLLFDTAKRAPDRSRYVGTMRVAATLAQWKRAGWLTQDQSESVYLWKTPSGNAYAGMADVEKLPEPHAQASDVRDTRAGLEGTGTLIEVPVLISEQVPWNTGTPIATTPNGVLESVPGSISVTCPVFYDSGEDQVEALRLILVERATNPIRIPVWISVQSAVPPPGLLLWGWADEVLGVR